MTFPARPLTNQSCALKVIVPLTGVSTVVVIAREGHVAGIQCTFGRSGCAEAMYPSEEEERNSRP